MGQDKGGEKARIASGRSYVITWLTLLLLLGLNISVSEFMVTRVTALLNIVIASCMAIVNLVYFMNLRYEGRFLKMMVLLTVLALTLIILFTFSDVWFRGK